MEVVKARTEYVERGVVLRVLFVAMAYFGKQLLERRVAGCGSDVSDTSSLEEIRCCLRVGLEDVRSDLLAQALDDRGAKHRIADVRYVLSLLHHAGDEVLGRFVNVLRHDVEVASVPPAYCLGATKTC